MTFRTLVLPALAMAGTLLAQVEIPPNPTVLPRKFPTRKVGGGVDPGASLGGSQSPAPLVKNVTHIVLHPSRLWTSVDGKPLEAKLIAFEDLVSTGAESAMPEPPAHPTVVREGKARLLVAGKPVVIALEKLSGPDRQLIATIESSLAAKAKAGR